ncbi:MAG: respiratory nitrate reductase subunit gamma, partial [Cyanobacteria bacterium HKST-UBA05]|nr:respiratory nitrate reductase subunit gamma [Cyanobacteria bacterium HKST-UBA05]
MNTIDQLIFGVLPYLAMALFFIETIRRYVTEKYSYTTMSSQFLENKQHFWGMMAFHYGIIGTIAGHIIAFLLPKSVLWWNSYPIR